MNSSLGAWTALRWVLNPWALGAIALATALNATLSPAWGQEATPSTEVGDAEAVWSGDLGLGLLAKPEMAKPEVAKPVTALAPGLALNDIVNAEPTDSVPPAIAQVAPLEPDTSLELAPAERSEVFGRAAYLQVGDDLRNSLAKDSLTHFNDPHLPLGYALLAYRTGQMTVAVATETLDTWLASQSLETPPPDLVELVGALPADSSRASLYQTLLTQRPNDLWLQWRTIQLLAVATPSQAQAAMEALIAANPNDLTVYFFQGELAQQQGDLPLAAAAYEQVLTQEPDNIGALSALAGVQFQQGNLAAARALYAQVLELDADDWQARYAIAELSIANDQRLLALDQLRQIPPEVGSANLEQRAQEVEFDLLRRRGFQPGWERY